MNRILKPIVIGLGVLALGACETTSDNLDLYNQATGASPGGTAFDTALYNGYVQLANEEQNPYADYDIDGASRDFYSNRALASAAGQTVLPTDVAARALPPESVAEVTDGRARLMAALDGTARDKAPAAAGRAQTQFDCWLEQLEENYQPQDIARCRQGFFDALAQAEAALRPAAVAPAPAPAAPGRPEPFLVFFDFDESVITPESARVIAEAARRAQESGAAAIQVVGHTDTSGSNAYNDRLSMRRANAVRDELARNGIEASTVTVEGRGESDPLVPTADGVREPQNRRAEGIWIYR
ncbi:MAG: OmpA family protein [Alphaproteobacteria bacterium]